MRAIEFFSGIGAFAYACRATGIEVAAAFDQSADANLVYAHNFDHKPFSRNLDTIPGNIIPDADLWWMSPPCKPYTIRGARRDEVDPRSKSFAHLLKLLSDKLPTHVIVENVVAFESSRMFERLSAILARHDYAVRVERLCSSQFGTPMKRPRVFVVASRRINDLDATREHSTDRLDQIQRIPLEFFINANNEDGRLTVPPELVAKYELGMNIITPGDPDAYAICFTSGYDSSYSSSGSFLQIGTNVRRFAPEEILALLGFGPDYKLPPSMELKTQWRLVGNSVDVRSIRYLLQSLERTNERVKKGHDSPFNL